MLSTTCKYGIRACVFLALNGDGKMLSIKYIAKGLDVPEPFLGKIMQSLSKKKILYSQRGIDGGFRFNKNPHKVTILEIIDIFDGLDIFTDCVLGMRICQDHGRHHKDCPFSKKADPLLDKFYKIFKEQTIGDFADRLGENVDSFLI